MTVKNITKQYSKGGLFDSFEEMRDFALKAKKQIEEEIIADGFEVPLFKSLHWRVIRDYVVKYGRDAIRIDCFITDNPNDLLYYHSVAKDLEVNKELFND